ncbi:hypothetical protein I8752_29130 [Nostocaceae cyanobacterium CENA369]|uniref:Uncharacterized protein n=1 Tax=Dendronalium phyllosphericum CENA369 TaxID=1725256 RepID=A0A8J7I6G5_9NOST|nr:hypothetical protein [Dendronalium phyllosphericum]MBH8576975.1 hypothetical protein [Dendronalium phyllosphericum CENA369]
MSQNSYKINLPWSESHEAFCYKHHICPAAKSLWQWLMRQGEISTEVEPDLSEFNATVAKSRGKGYSHNYLKYIFNQLVKHRVIQVVRQYSWKIYKLLVRPLEWLNPPKKQKLQNSNKSYNSHPSSDSNAVASDIQQQHSNNKQLLEDNGIYYDDDITEVLHRPTNEIKLAILIFILRGGFEEIKNPEGFIRDCLRGKWWEHPRNYNHLLQAYGNSTEWDELFPSG